MIQPQLKQRWLVMLSLISLYFIWGSTFLAMKFAMDDFPPFMMAGLRFLIAGGLLFGALRLRGVPNPSLPQWGGAAAVGILLLAVGNAGVAYAEQWVATGAAALVIATVPLWAMFFAGLWGHWPHRREWLGIGLGILGVLILNLGGNMRARVRWARPCCWRQRRVGHSVRYGAAACPCPAGRWRPPRRCWLPARC